MAKEETKPIKEETIPIKEETKPIKEEPITVSTNVPESNDITTMIADISAVKPIERGPLLQRIFNTMKAQLTVYTGVQLGTYLEKLKDQILDNIGTSLALFDISKNTRDLMKIQNMLPENKVAYYAERIDNWAKRIIK
jgi:hypothetical protein